MNVILAVMPFFTSIQICGLTDKQTGRQEGKQTESQADRQTDLRRDSFTNIHVHFCTDILYIYRHRDTQMDRQASGPTDRYCREGGGGGGGACTRKEGERGNSSQSRVENTNMYLQSTVLALKLSPLTPEVKSLYRSIF
jgi:hypothetical protein